MRRLILSALLAAGSAVPAIAAERSFPTGGGFDEMKGQLIFAPIRILRAERLDGTPHPSGRFKTWLVFKHR